MAKEAWWHFRERANCTQASSLEMKLKDGGSSIITVLCQGSTYWISCLTWSVISQAWHSTRWAKASYKATGDTSTKTCAIRNNITGQRWPLPNSAFPPFKKKASSCKKRIFLLDKVSMLSRQRLEISSQRRAFWFFITASFCKRAVKHASAWKCACHNEKCPARSTPASALPDLFRPDLICKDHYWDELNLLLGQVVNPIYDLLKLLGSRKSAHQELTKMPLTAFAHEVIQGSHDHQLSSSTL